MNSVPISPTEEQWSIIAHDSSAFVEACPGAGKTWVMTERARRIFADETSYRGVAFLSFTRSAVFELNSRLRKEGLLSVPAFPSFIGTFDSFVWQFLVAPFGISDCELSPRLVPDLADSLVIPFPGAQALPLSCFSPDTGTIDAVAANARGFDVVAKPGYQIQAYVTTARRMRAGLRDRGLLGYDEARGVALQRIGDSEAGPRIAAALVARFREAIVDEAQDCNPDDLHIMSWLKDAGLPVKVVCDPQQAIYSFRGGVTDQLLAFASTFRDDERKRLSGNFRSAPNICKATAQLRPPASRTPPDEPLGPNKNDATPVRILAYSGASVPAAIGAVFTALVVAEGIGLDESPITAATAASGAAAAGQPRATTRRDRVVRLAEAVTRFHFAAGFHDVRIAIDEVHKILLEVQGSLGEQTYRQYMAENDIELSTWRPLVLALLRALRFDPETFGDAVGWHTTAKRLIAESLMVSNGASISQKLRWNEAVSDVLVAVPVETAAARTIHSVKGMEFPAICVVTTPKTIGKILDFLETGEPAESAEDARKLYVAATRAERLLVIAAPKRQSDRLARLLRGLDAVVTVEEIDRGAPEVITGE